MIQVLRTSHRWQRWQGLTRAERRLALHSLVLLIKAHYALPRVQWLPEGNRPPSPGADATVVATQCQRAHLVARMVAHAAAMCPVQVACLHRSWVLRQLLVRERIPCSVRIGVRSDPSLAFGAHAWVECHGEPLHEAADPHAQFAAFESAFVPVPARRSGAGRTAA